MSKHLSYEMWFASLALQPNIDHRLFAASTVQGKGTKGSSALLGNQSECTPFRVTRRLNPR